jgi:hypothetical protein
MLGTPSDNTKLVITIQELRRQVEIVVTGCSYAVAEIGEQLSWLNAALSSPHHSFHHNNIISVQPWYSSSMASSLSTDSLAYNVAVSEGRTKVFDLGFRPSSNSTVSHQHHSNNNSRVGTCWKDLFGELILVAGFPIPRRIVPDTGIEITLPLMAALANSQKLAVFSGKPLIKGFSTALIPTQHCNGFIYWHIVSNEDGDYLGFNDYQVKIILDQYPSGLAMHDLEYARHILGWCSQVKNKTGTFHPWLTAERHGTWLK